MSSNDYIRNSPMPSPATANVDSALISALRDSRERVALLKLEKTLIDFINSDTKWIEVGGPFNSVIHVPSHTGAHGGESSTRLSRRSATAVVSAGTIRQSSFHKVLVHRLADRFKIIRENGIVLENSIRLRKLPTSVIPPVLLQHALSSIKQHKELSSSPTPGTPTLASSSSSSGTTTKSKSKSSKMKIMMKRSSSNNGTDKNKNNNNNNHHNNNSKSQNNNTNSRSNRRTMGNVSDREKAYAEARARILGKTEEDEDNNDNHNSHKNDSDRKSSSQTPIADVDAVFPARRPDENSIHGNGGIKNNNHGGSHTNLAAKAVLRNYEEEAKDPDFQRNHLPMPVTTSQLVPSQVWST